MQSSLPVYVGYIGLKSVTLCGEKCRSYRTGVSVVRRGCIINHFDTETELNAFLQGCINNDVPFADDTKSNAYQEAYQLKAVGKLQGILKSIT